jgi:hypothetical protein
LAAAEREELLRVWRASDRVREEIEGGARAGRAVIVAEASPRAPGRDQMRTLALHELGGGADRYRLEVDAERGILLGTVALWNGEPFREITTVEIAFDEPIADERFISRPPAGEVSAPRVRADGASMFRSTRRSDARRLPCGCRAACPTAGI